jgi:hypothetical protein
LFPIFAGVARAEFGKRAACGEKSARVVVAAAVDGGGSGGEDEKGHYLFQKHCWGG